jgi:hypothetical protein
MKMIQTEICAGRPNTEIFYDGQIRVDYSQGTFGVADVPRKDWQNALIMRGYRALVEEEPTPPKSRKKVTNE